MTPTSIATQLETMGYCIYPDFLSPSELLETRDDLDTIQKAHGFHRAGVGHGTTLQVHETVRRDEICWLDRENRNEVQARLWGKVDRLQKELNSPPYYLGLDSFEGHYASYPSGGFYRRHLDRSINESSRVVSFVVYLNIDWKPGDGGRLRIFKNKTPDSPYSDV
ncbi:MAG: 2OG-Fe(II) oxygenase, partial [Bdellovibrionia bacterium]